MLPRTLVLMAAALLPACATPPERTEREQALRAALEPCLQRYPAVRLTGIDDYGHVYARAQEHDDVDGFLQCAGEEVKRRRDLFAIGTGKLAQDARPTTVAIREMYSAFLVPVKINGISTTLVLDTGATQTLVKPEVAARAGLEVTSGAFKVRGNVVGGRRVEVPLVRARSVSVGEASIEDIDIGVYDATPGRPGVDGLLGATFLHHFKFTVDRKNLQLILEPEE